MVASSTVAVPAGSVLNWATIAAAMSSAAEGADLGRWYVSYRALPMAGHVRADSFWAPTARATFAASSSVRGMSSSPVVGDLDEAVPGEGAGIPVVVARNVLMAAPARPGEPLGVGEPDPVGAVRGGVGPERGRLEGDVPKASALTGRMTFAHRSVRTASSASGQ
jgi:hypothetical protein